MRVAAVTLLGLVLAGSAAGAAPRPVLKIVGASVVRGAHFTPGSRIELTFDGARAFRRATVRADRSGSFSHRLPFLPGRGRCGTYLITAVGADGERALVGMGSTCSRSIPIPKIPTGSGGTA